MLERNKPTSDDSLFLIKLIIYSQIEYKYGAHLANQTKSNTEEMSNFHTPCSARDRLQGSTLTV